MSNEPVLISPHSHTASNGASFIITGATVPGCHICDEDKLISRLSVFVRQWNPYQPHRVDPWRLADLLEGKDSPLDDYPVAGNERVWSFLGDRLSGGVVWGVNWTFGVQIWGGRDWGLFDVDLGPLRLHNYARWGLTEAQRTKRWLEHA